MSEESNSIDRPVMLEAIGLSKNYGMFMAVKNLNFTIREGEVVAFLGPNGAGKSTTMKMLTGYLAPTEGEAWICGESVAENRLAVANRIGYLPENGPLYEEMTPLTLLDFFGNARGIESHLLKSRIEAVVDQCALSTVTNKPIGKLSRGYRQRVGMANVLLHQPDVLIMDEPTAGLDPNQILEVRKTIKGLGKTVLLSTHILQEVREMADRILLINRGSLVFDGKPEDLDEESSLDKWFNTQTAA
ncbi:MAG: multidrug ABC transporter ATP-binding protein [Opitutales bacterium]|jgi:ABC-2 type transport system ATP-binding protein|nr:multidrug ABC transporter ATP-binding protein [Opitutales bacterium]|tara:strand:+ start:431 stop:1165 length:735 start_codon:yes stop_codon:yes gene_type:complete